MRALGTVLPALLLVLDVTFDFPEFETEDRELIPKATAFRSGMRNRYLVEPHGSETVADPEEIEVPAEVAEKNFAFADLSLRPPFGPPFERGSGAYGRSSGRGGKSLAPAGHGVTDSRVVR